jgi:hypothetical protein
MTPCMARPPALIAHFLMPLGYREARPPTIESMNSTCLILLAWSRRTRSMRRQSTSCPRCWCDRRGCQDRQLAQLLARDMGEKVSAGAASVRAQNLRLIQQVGGICECRLACLLDPLGRKLRGRLKETSLPRPLTRRRRLGSLGHGIRLRSVAKLTCGANCACARNSPRIREGSLCDAASARCADRGGCCCSPPCHWVPAPISVPNCSA